MSDKLEVRGLSCRRGDARLFTGLAFEIAAGTSLAVRGPNGSGKTTLLRCVAGLTRADGGEIHWRGKRVEGRDPSWRADIAWSGHLAAIKDDLTAEENLAFALRLRGAVAVKQDLAQALVHAGLGARRRLAARRLSAGQRRRIGLARLSLDPAIVWVLDEPLTALDDEGQAYFASLLARHLDKGGLALVATHHPMAIEPARSRELRLDP
jgi:heme exporter protein A